MDRRVRTTTRAWRSLVALVAVASTAVCGCGSSPGPSGGVRAPDRPGPGIHHIRHVVVVVQENRSFDSYFGTFPGADGLPRRDGRFTVCVPDPRAGRCQRPYHDPSQVNGGAHHDRRDGFAAINGGRMDGFVRVAEERPHRGCTRIPVAGASRVCLSSRPPDVMGYHDAREIPNYWAYAYRYVLQDHMFEPVQSWSWNGSYGAPSLGTGL